ncbi:hypothetical protein ACIQGZ_25805 [Streptomyces sp. NPDC092296]|uniref:hypothetical protein n=1 Tax=Streptomyces sp. NPDC092296 TaxID=3366012 RepID=UPI003820A24B
MIRMIRTKKYLVAACAVAALAGAPTGAFALGTPDVAAPLSAGHSGAAAHSGAAGNEGAVKVVAPGEKVPIGGGATLWLTEDGRQCVRQPGSAEARCNTASRSRPWVVMTFVSSGSDGRTTIAGSFTAGDAPARISARTLNGVAEGTVVTLAGNPGWGAWYADAGIGGASRSPLKGSRIFLRGLTLYGVDGRAMVSFEEGKHIVPRGKTPDGEVTVASPTP